MKPEFLGDVEKDIEWTISTLGCLDKDGYAKEPDCHEAIKDLIRFLKRDKRESCPNRRVILGTGLIENDLIPILKFHDSDADVFDGTLRLLINLTQPAVTCFADASAERANLDKTTTTLAKELLCAHQKAKVHFADKQLMIVLSKRLKNYLEKSPLPQVRGFDRQFSWWAGGLLSRYRSTSDLRGPLTQSASPPAKLAMKASHLLHRRSKPQEWFEEWENRHEEERLVCERILLLVENALCIPRSPEDSQRSDTDVTAQDQLICAVDESGLAELLLFICNSSEQSQFHMNVLRIVAHMLEEHKPVDLASAGKQRSGEEKRREEAEIAAIVAKEEEKLKSQKRHRSARRILSRNEDTLVTNRGDGDVYYLWAIKFFTDFAVKLDNKPLDRVSETLDVESFHYAQTRLDNYLEMCQGDKRDAVSWGAKARVAIGAYKVLLQALQVMTMMPAFKDSADKIKETVFYVSEYRELGLNLFKKYNQAYLSRMYLTDLVEATGMYLRSLEKFCTESGGFLVQKKRKKRKRKNANRENTARTQENAGPSADDLEEIWENMTAELCSCLQGHEELPADAIPFDAAMEVDDDTHRKVAMARIQKALRESRAPDAVALYRAARDLWPEDNIFGEPNAEPEMEFMELKEILVAELEQIEVEGGVEDAEQDMEIEDFLYHEELGEEGNEENVEFVMKETQFEFRDYLKKFAKPDVIRCYILLLENCEENSVGTNRWITKFLDKIAFQLDMAPLLYQASLFRILQKLGKNPAYRKMPQLTELREFGKQLIRKFFEHVKGTGPKVFVELLFWKNAKQAYEIEYGYGNYRNEEEKVKNKGWTEELEYEAEGLYEQYQTLEEKPEGMDVLDFIQANLPQTMTKSSIRKFLKNRGYSV